MQRPIALLFAAVTALSLTACSSFTLGIYKLDVRQGNVLEPEKVAQLQPGMSKLQVQNVLGSPLLIDPFHQDRWDYVYAFYPQGNRKKGEERHLVLHFQGDVLARLEGQETIPSPPDTAQSLSTAQQTPQQQPAFFQFGPPGTTRADELLTAPPADE